MSVEVEPSELPERDEPAVAPRRPNELELIDEALVADELSELVPGEPSDDGDGVRTVGLGVQPVLSGEIVVGVSVVTAGLGRGWPGCDWLVWV